MLRLLADENFNDDIVRGCCSANPMLTLFACEMSD